MAGSAKINKWLERIVIIVCVLTPTAVAVPWHKLVKITEFFQYYAVSRLIQSGAYSQIYNTSTIKNIGQTLGIDFSQGYPPFIVPPIISWLFYPLAFLDFKQALYLWILILLISVLVAYWMLCRFLGLRGAKRLWAAVLLGAMGPLTVSIWKGYVAPLLLLVLVGLFVNLKKRNFLLVSLYQSLLWLQPQLIFPLLCFEFGFGQIYTVIITFLVAVIGLLISCLIGGMNIVNIWYQLFFRQMHNGAGNITDCTLQGQLLRFAVNTDLSNQIAIVVYFLLLIGAFILGKQVKNKQWQLSILLTALVPLSLCLCFHSLSEDLLLLFPGIIVLILMSIKNWLKYGRSLLIMCSLAILFLPFYMIISRCAIESSIFNPFFWLLIVFAIAALIIEKSSLGHNAGPDV